jgi:hypothetical protein
MVRSPASPCNQGNGAISGTPFYQWQSVASCNRAIVQSVASCDQSVPRSLRGGKLPHPPDARAARALAIVTSRRGIAVGQRKQLGPRFAWPRSASCVAVLPGGNLETRIPIFESCANTSFPGRRAFHTLSSSRQERYKRYKAVPIFPVVTFLILTTCAPSLLACHLTHLTPFHATLPPHSFGHFGLAPPSLRPTFGHFGLAPPPPHRAPFGHLVSRRRAPVPRASTLWYKSYTAVPVSPFVPICPPLSPFSHLTPCTLHHAWHAIWRRLFSPRSGHTTVRAAAVGRVASRIRPPPDDPSGTAVGLPLRPSTNSFLASISCHVTPLTPCAAAFLWSFWSRTAAAPPRPLWSFWSRLPRHPTRLTPYHASTGGTPCHPCNQWQSMTRRNRAIIGIVQSVVPGNFATYDHFVPGTCLPRAL